MTERAHRPRGTTRPLALWLAVGLSAGCGPTVHGPGPKVPRPASQPASAPQSAPASRPATQPATQPATKPACEAWVVDYVLVGGTALRVADTYMGAGDGVYLIGPGTVRLRFTSRDGAPAPGDAALLDLHLTTRFTLNTTALGFKMRIVTDGVSGFTADDCGVVARGTYDDGRLSWSEPARGYRSSGTIACYGVLCGKFGSPPSGRSALHRGPRDVKLKTLQFRDGVKRFSMGYVEVERQRKPSQTVLLKFEARETGRICVPAPPCTLRAAP